MFGRQLGGGDAKAVMNERAQRLVRSAVAEPVALDASGKLLLAVCSFDLC